MYLVEGGPHLDTCPFCGSIAEMLEDEKFYEHNNRVIGRVIVRCSNVHCGATMRKNYYNEKDADNAREIIAKKWNKRFDQGVEK